MEGAGTQLNRYKVAYHIGDTIGIKTKVESGFVVFDNNEFKLTTRTGSYVASLTNISQISLFMLHGLGSTLKIQTVNSTIFLSVVRFCMAGQFILVNRFSTRKLKKLLESSAGL